MPELSVGDVHDGYQFIGGIPTEPASWKPVEAAGEQSGSEGYTQGMATRFGIGAAQPMIGAGQLWSHGGADVADYLGAGDTMVGRGGRKIAKLFDTKADEFSDWAKQERAKAGLPEKSDLLSPSTWDIAGGIGELASPINLAAGGIAGSAMRGAGAGLIGRAAQGAGYGAAYGAAQPVTSEDTEGGKKSYRDVKTEQIGSGAIGGAIGGPLAGLAGDIAGPRLSEAARYLHERGVRLTPGQLLQGLSARVEGGLQSVPLSGEMVREARAEAIPGFNRAAHNEALGHIGEALPEDVAVGHDAMIHTIGRTNQAYNDVHSRLTATATPQLVNDVNQATQDASRGLTRDNLQHFQDLVRSNLVERFADNNGALNGNQVQAAQSELRKIIRSYTKSPDPQQNIIARHLGAVQRSMDRLLVQQNPADAARLRAINRLYAHQIVLEKATANTATQPFDGAFTPTQLGKAAGQSSTTRQLATREALYQDLVEHGRAIIPSRVPDSGTAERHALLGILGIGGAHAAGVAPHAMVGMAGVAATYTEPVQRLIQAAIAGSPQTRGPLGDFIRRYGPRVATPLLIEALKGNAQSQQQVEDAQ
jgi:hypothetical protein